MSENHEEQLDPTWFRISRFRPSEEAIEILLKLLNHPRWEVRWNAARELYFEGEERALDSLMNLLKNDPNNSVRNMASRALGALYDAGIDVPLYAAKGDHNADTRIKRAIARLKELKVSVYRDKAFYRIKIRHDLPAPFYIEIGYLMAQLTDDPFPEKYSPSQN